MYTKDELRKIFCGQFDSQVWKKILLDFFKASDIRPNPQVIPMDQVDDRGFYLGKSVLADGTELGFFHFQLNSGSVVRRRVGLRKLVEPFLKYSVNAAIVVFSDLHHWRMSFVSDFGKTATAPKRFTYTFGDPSQMYNTPVNRLSDMQGKPLTIAVLYDTFSVEALSDEFFKEYKALYEQLCTFVYNHKNDPEYFDAEFAVWEDKMVRDYVKKMMGRLVFLQYLQKKGWMGGNSNYLRSLFHASPYKADFLDKVLEPLFFGVFNTLPALRHDLFVQEGWDIDMLAEWKEFPFLSGGLFEQDKLDCPRSRFPENYFIDIFDFLTRYNFTIDENDPNDAEVGVDPEMLGKIFENLLEDNKDKGAFYTPKEIVRYMSCESVIQYLKTHTDESLHADIEALVNQSEIAEDSRLREGKVAKEVSQLLKEVKVCDPAIGSGAFPMGVLNVIYSCRRALHEANSTEEFNTVQVKKQIIQNNIYGVDIEQGAVDIARLRFWLALLVDAKTPEALPNLDYKIMRGNSLIPTFDGKYINLEVKSGYADAKKNEKLKELVELQRQYYGKTGDEKLRAEIQIKEVILDIVSLQIGKEIRIWEEKNATQTNIFEKRSFDELRKILPEEKVEVLRKGDRIRQRLNDESIGLQVRATTNLDFFDWKIMFSDVFESKGGFDIVIGNPPYIQLQKDGGWHAQIYEPCKFYTFARTGDIYSLFYEKGCNLLRQGGNLCFITSNKWMRAGYGEKTREFFTTQTNPILLIDFGGVKIFDSATVDTNILLLAKEENQGKTRCVTMSKDEKNCLQNLSLFVKQHEAENTFNGADSWVILSAIERSIKQKI